MARRAGKTDEAATARALDEQVRLQDVLDHVLDHLGRDVIQVVVAPRGLDVPVAELMIYDAEERSSISRDAVVVAVGARAGTPPGDRLLEAAGQAGAAAVVFKAAADLAELAAVGDGTRVMHLGGRATPRVGDLELETTWS